MTYLSLSSVMNQKILFFRMAKLFSWSHTETLLSPTSSELCHQCAPPPPPPPPPPKCIQKVVLLLFDVSYSSGAVWESRWLSWAVRPNEPSGFHGHKAMLNTCFSNGLSLSLICQLTSEDIKQYYLPACLMFCLTKKKKKKKEKETIMTQRVWVLTCVEM